MNKPAILLINLGTPDSPSYFDVFKYLREFLMDGRVIDIPSFFRFILVTLIICPIRSFASSKIYKELWDLSGGVSPLLKNTEELTKKLNSNQNKYNVHFAMRYQKPGIKKTLEAIIRIQSFRSNRHDVIYISQTCQYILFFLIFC